MNLPKMELSDLSESQWNRIRYEKCKPVVDIDGQAIGVAKTKRGAAFNVCLMAGGPLNEIEQHVKEYDDRYVIGGMYSAVD